MLLLNSTFKHFSKSDKAAKNFPAQTLYPYYSGGSKTDLSLFRESPRPPGEVDSRHLRDSLTSEFRYLYMETDKNKESEELSPPSSATSNPKLKDQSCDMYCHLNSVALVDVMNLSPARGRKTHQNFDRLFRENMWAGDRPNNLTSVLPL